MNKQLKEILSKILLIDTDKVKEGLSRSDLEDWDSLTHLVLMTDIEKEFSVSFTDEEIVEIDSIKDILELLDRHNAT